MPRFILCLLAILVSSSVVVSASVIHPDQDLSLSSSQVKQKVNFVLDSAIDVSSINKKVLKKAKIKISDNSSLVKFKPGIIKVKKDSEDNLILSSTNLLANKKQIASLEEDLTVTVTLSPNSVAEELGIDASEFELTLIAGDTESLALEINFSGSPVLPLVLESESFVLPELSTFTSYPRSTDIETTIKIPANAASCALGLGGAPLSTSVGPGTLLSESKTRYGIGTSDDPLYIVFNNPYGPDGVTSVDLSSIPSELMTTEEGVVSGFAQMYEGENATGEVLITVQGTVTGDPDNQTFTLTLENGTKIIFAKDGSKKFIEPAQDISEFTDSVGIDEGTAKSFLNGEALEVFVPKAIIEAEVLEVLSSRSDLTNPSVSLASNATGTLTLDVNRLSGSFSTSGSFNFDVDGLGNVVFTDSSFSMQILAEKPAQLKGFTVDSANAVLTITGGNDFVNQITAKMKLINPSVDLAAGISVEDIVITDLKFSPDLSDITVPDSNDGDGDGSAFEQCIEQCMNQGGTREYCEVNICSEYQ